MVGSFLKIKFEFRDVEKSRSSERRRFGRVDDRDLDFGLALADQLDRERAARRDARSACNTQGNRSENCCVQEKTPRKITACSLRFDPETGCLADPEGKNGSQRNWTGMTRAASDVGCSYADEIEKAGNGTLPI